MLANPESVPAWVQAGAVTLAADSVCALPASCAGMLVNPESMPAWIRWTHWASPFFYSYSSLMINEMSAIKIDFAVSAGCCRPAPRACARPALGGGPRRLLRPPLLRRVLHRRRHLNPPLPASPPSEANAPSTSRQLEGHAAAPNARGTVLPTAIHPHLLTPALPAHALSRPSQLEGYAAASNVRGTVFLTTIGINADNLTVYIIATAAFYLAFVSGPRLLCAVRQPRAWSSAGRRADVSPRPCKPRACAASCPHPRRPLHAHTPRRRLAPRPCPRSALHRPCWPSSCSTWWCTGAASSTASCAPAAGPAHASTTESETARQSDRLSNCCGAVATRVSTHPPSHQPPIADCLHHTSHL